MMPNLLKHAPNLAIPTLGERKLIPRIFRFAHHPHLGRGGLHALAAISRNGESTPNLGKPVCRGHTGNLHHIRLRHVRRSLHQRVGELAIVGQQEQTFACVVESPNGINPHANAAQYIHHGRTAFGIAD